MPVESNLLKWLLVNLKKIKSNCLSIEKIQPNISKGQGQRGYDYLQAQQCDTDAEKN